MKKPNCHTIKSYTEQSGNNEENNIQLVNISVLHQTTEKADIALKL
jgi:hypothetical protein